MDYSRFYLKNYTPPKDSDDEKDDSQSIPLVRTSSPEIIYINPDGEEFTPEVAKTDDEDCSLSEKTEYGSYSEIKEQKPQNDLLPAHNAEDIYSAYRYNKKSQSKAPEQGKKSHLNKFFQALCIFVIVVMTLIVCADFLSDGKAISAFSQLISSKQTYYAVIADPKDDLQSAKISSYAFRLKGLAGYVIKKDGKYYNVLNVFDNEKSAQDCAEEYSASSITIQTNAYDDIEGDLKKYRDYHKTLIQSLSQTADDLTQKKTDTSKAIEELDRIRTTFEQTYKEMDAASKNQASKNSVALLANASVASGALTRLCDTSVQRPNLVCDIRYTACLILFSYAYSL